MVIRSIAIFCLLVAAAVFSGCGGDKVETYRIPKDIAAAEQPAIQPPAMDAPAAGPAMSSTPARESAFTWDFPSNWTTQTGTSNMRLASYRTPGGSDFSIIRLMDSDDLSNVNRWLGQLGRQPVDQAGLAPLTEHLDLGGKHMHLFTLDGPPATDRSILAGIYRESGMAWFYKMDGSRSDIRTERSNMIGVMASMRKGSPAAQASASPPESTPDSNNMQVLPGMQDQVSGIPDASWELPESWKAVEGNPIRKATIQVADGAAEMAVTAFPGDVGGLEANINRWRRQLGLSPASPGEIQNFTQAIEVDGRPGTLMYFSSGYGNDKEGLLGLIVELERATWFFKMTGPSGLLLAEQPRFERFAQTISFSN